MTEQTTVRNREAHEAAEKLADYEWGFTSDIEQEFAPKGLNEDTVRFISGKKGEPEWMLDWRLKAYRAWLEMEEVSWAKLDIPEIDYQDAYYYAAPKRSRSSASSTRSIPKSCASTKSSASRSRSRRCSPASKARRRVAVDAVFDSCQRRHHFPRGAEEGGRHLPQHQRGDPRISGAGEEVSRLASFRSATITSPASTARSFPTAPSSTCPRASAARWSCRPISASMPRIPASSSAP